MKLPSFSTKGLDGSNSLFSKIRDGTGADKDGLVAVIIDNDGLMVVFIDNDGLVAVFINNDGLVAVFTNGDGVGALFINIDGPGNNNDDECCGALFGLDL